MAFSSRDYIFLQEISSNIMPHDQHIPPTNNVAPYPMRMQIFDTTGIELRAQPIVNEVVDDEENYNILAMEIFGAVVSMMQCFCGETCSRQSVSET
uniref:Uncharacterized protein n=1 Tax=Solanum lycopersicum TaxID=4081 RepID=A0A3Q7J2C4_SOLLC